MTVTDDASVAPGELDAINQVITTVEHAQNNERPDEFLDPGTTRIPVPRPVVRDVPGIQALADTLVDGIADVVRVDLPNTAHTPPLERPSEVAAAVTQLLARAAWQ